MTYAEILAFIEAHRAEYEAWLRAQGLAPANGSKLN